MSKHNEVIEAADLQIGPTNLGNVRFIILLNGKEINMDFDPSEALEIAEEIKIAAERASQMDK